MEVIGYYILWELATWCSPLNPSVWTRIVLEVINCKSFMVKGRHAYTRYNCVKLTHIKLTLIHSRKTSELMTSNRYKMPAG